MSGDDLQGGGGQTKTVTRETVEVKEVEETLYLCHNCGQGYEKDEMVTVGVDLEAGGKAEEERQLCTYCSDSLLGYSVDESATNYVSHATREWDATDITKTLLSSGIFALLTLGGIGAIFSGLGYMIGRMNEFALSVEDPSTTTATEMSGSVMELVPIVFGALFVTVVLSWLDDHGKL